MADTEVEAKSGAEEVLDQALQDSPNPRNETADHPEPEASTTLSVEQKSQSPIIEDPPESHEGTKSGSTGPKAPSVDREIQSTAVTKQALPPSLWCPVRGRNHANLIEFDIRWCHLCRQNLEPPPQIGAPDFQAKSVESSDESSDEAASDGSHSADGSHSDDGSKSNVDSEASQAPDRKYGIQFLDSAGGHVARRPWHEILDLETERAKMSRQTDPPVETVTLVTTSLSSEWRKFIAPGQLEDLADGFLTNPNYTMEIDCMRVDIGSDHIRQALRQIVVYSAEPRPPFELMYIIMPYCLFYHHWDEIMAYQRTFKGAEDYDESSEGTELTKWKAGFKPCDEIAYNHLTVLRNAIESQNSAAVLEEKKRHEQSPSLATFSMLWLLLKPSTTVYTEIHGKLAACVIKSFEFTPPFSLRKESTAYRVQLWHLQYDGKVLGRHKLTRYISTFEGEKKLIDLEIIPAEFYDAYDGGALRKRLEARGEKYFKYISGPRQVEYRGESLGDVAYWYEGRAVLDTHAYYNHGMYGAGVHHGDAVIRRPLVGAVPDDTDGHLGQNSRNPRPPGPLPPPPPPPPGPFTPVSDARSGSENSPSRSRTEGPWAAYDNIDPRDTETLDLVDATTGEISRHRYLLCPADIIGFVLKPRRWDVLDVECCSDIKFDTAAIDSIVMPDERKMIIKSLVYRFSDNDAINGKIPAPWTADFVQNKGEGQIFLLHGSPGVGKTLRLSECIAESAGRPLLSLTCGDIGTVEKTAEEKLSKWFRLAELWGAVMLIDEADIYLEKRATSDLSRNSLVSIFLRTMEYYRGILFLTTNRVGHFDDAFVSRVHVVIRYENLSEKDRAKIWSQFFNKLQAERGKYITISRKARRYVSEDEEVTKIPWNGREIRNAFQTAVAFAEYRFAHTPADQRDEKACLEEEDFAKVCEMTGAFKHYLHSISGRDESMRARSDQARNDSFGSRN